MSLPIPRRPWVIPADKPVPGRAVVASFDPFRNCGNVTPRKFSPVHAHYCGVEARVVARVNRYGK